MMMTMMMEKKASVYKAYGLYSETEFFSFGICDDTSLILFFSWFDIYFFVRFVFFHMLFPKRKKKKKTRRFLFPWWTDCANAFAFRFSWMWMLWRSIFYSIVYRCLTRTMKTRFENNYLDKCVHNADSFLSNTIEYVAPLIANDGNDKICIYLLMLNVLCSVFSIWNERQVVISVTRKRNIKKRMK